MLVNRQRSEKIFHLAFPIMGGMVSQTALNLVDTAMVSTLGDVALAAVGLGSFATFMSQAMIQGLGSGVQSMVARRLGEGKLREAAYPLNGGIFLALSVALPVSVFLYVLAPYLFPPLNENVQVQVLGTDYFQWRLLGAVGVGVNFCFRGYWNGINQSKLYMRTLFLMHGSNVIISYILIFGLGFIPAMGVQGAAIGTTLATYLGTAYYVVLGFRHARPHGFAQRFASRQTLLRIASLSLPAGLQLLAFSSGLMTLFWMVGRAGGVDGTAAYVSAANILVNLTLFAILPGLGLGMAASSLVSQALGRADVEDARRWGWDVVKVGCLILGLLGLPMIVCPDFLLALFLKEKSTVDIALWPLRIVGMGLVFDAVGLVLQHCLLGAGASKIVLVVSTSFQWLLFLPIAYLVGPHLKWGLSAIWSAQMLYRALQACVYAHIWHGKSWTMIKV
jgi:multidrug resistance protein, MATE family